jgi:sugar lactone lactonase YvrE
MADLRVVVDGLTFPEGPRWHDGRLWFSDFYSHRVLAVDPAPRGAGGGSAGGTAAVEEIVRVPAQPSGLGWDTGGHLLVVSMLDRRLCRLLSDGTLQTVADLGPWATGPANDMVVDRRGRAYVGNFGFDRHRGEPQRATVLLCVDPDGSVQVVDDDVLFPNGSVITPDGATLVVAETWRRQLTAWTIRRDGSVVDKRIWADLGEHHPDGICLDAEGALWVADPVGRCLLRVHEGGRVSATVTWGNEGRGPYACMLGGEGRRTLFVCTNTGSGPSMATQGEGRIEAMEVAVAGTGWP